MEVEAPADPTRPTPPPRTLRRALPTLPCRRALRRGPVPDPRRLSQRQTSPTTSSTPANSSSSSTSFPKAAGRGSHGKSVARWIWTPEPLVYLWIWMRRRKQATELLRRGRDSLKICTVHGAHPTGDGKCGWEEAGSRRVRAMEILCSSLRFGASGSLQ